MAIFKVDLHTHTTCSDGELNPTELVNLAAEQGLTHLSITDHDSIAAYEEAEPIARQKGVELLPGIELSTFGLDDEIHILGYGIDVSNKRLKSYCDWRKQERIYWTQEIVRKLQQLSYNIEWENCFRRATDGVMMRIHIAEELVAQGYFNHKGEAFWTLLASGCSAYVERVPFTTQQAIDLIHECGGMAFLAHPGIYSPDTWELETMIDEGIEGIEVYYTFHKETEVEKWKYLARRYDLMMSSGSDYHGPTSRNPRMVGSVPYDHSRVHGWMERLLPRKKAIAK